jgi:hypothetical protein
MDGGSATERRGQDGERAMDSGRNRGVYASAQDGRGRGAVEKSGRGSG